MRLILLLMCECSRITHFALFSFVFVAGDETSSENKSEHQRDTCDDNNVANASRMEENRHFLANRNIGENFFFKRLT